MSSTMSLELVQMLMIFISLIIRLIVIMHLIVERPVQTVLMADAPAVHDSVPMGVGTSV